MELYGCIGSTGNSSGAQNPCNASVGEKTALLPEKDFASSIFFSHIEEKLQIEGNH